MSSAVEVSEVRPPVFMDDLDGGSLYSPHRLLHSVYEYMGRFPNTSEVYDTSIFKVESEDGGSI